MVKDLLVTAGNRQFFLCYKKPEGGITGNVIVHQAI